MIYYVSESLNSKKNGGSSLSGLDFLQMMRIHYPNISVVSYDGLCHEKNETFYQYEINDIQENNILSRVYNPPKLTFLRYLKKKLISIQGIFRSSELQLDTRGSNVVFVNSWSQIIGSEQIKSFDDATKICIVRGNPESFVWQGSTNNPEHDIEVAANYLNRFDVLIFVSRIGMERWKEYLKTSIVSFYLPNSINEVEAQNVESMPSQKLTSSLGFENDVINLVALGSVQKRKGQDFLLKVAEQLSKRGYSFKIHIVGIVSKGWGGSDIVDEINRSVFSDCFVFHGHKNNVFEYIKAADICLFPSRAEAFPRTIAEYMSLGKPIVSTDVSGVPEMIEHGVSGLLSELDDVESFTENIVTLLENPSFRSKLGQKAKERYYAQFSKSCQIKTANKIFTEIDLLNEK